MWQRLVVVVAVRLVVVVGVPATMVDESCERLE